MIQGKYETSLAEAVSEMHSIARAVEAQIGQGKLSKDIREIADRLHEVLRMERKYGH